MNKAQELVNASVTTLVDIGRGTRVTVVNRAPLDIYAGRGVLTIAMPPVMATAYATTVAWALVFVTVVLDGVV